MRIARSIVPTALVAVLSACAGQRVSAPTPSLQGGAWNADEFKWQDSRIFPGAQAANLVGGSGSGPFTTRIRFSDGYRELPHWHTGVTYVTILSGAVHYGVGEQFDPARAKRYGAGAFVIIPARQPHFIWADGETVVQTHGIGERETVFVNPADDPRTRR